MNPPFRDQSGGSQNNHVDMLSQVSVSPWVMWPIFMQTDGVRYLNILLIIFRPNWGPKAEKNFRDKFFSISLYLDT